MPELVRLATEAVALLEDTDASNDRGAALLDLAEVLHLAGRHVGAGEAAERALGLLGEKGNVAGTARARERLAELAAVAP